MNPLQPSVPASGFEMTPEGLFVATRQWLLRRGTCCGNGCRNCPYPQTTYPDNSAKPRCRRLPDTATPAS